VRGKLGAKGRKRIKPLICRNQTGKSLDRKDPAVFRLRGKKGGGGGGRPACRGTEGIYERKEGRLVAIEKTCPCLGKGVPSGKGKKGREVIRIAVIKPNSGVLRCRAGDRASDQRGRSLFKRNGCSF